MRSKNGVTLIELITVLAVMSIVSSIAVPLIANYGRDQHMLLEVASKELLCDLRNAQEMARSRGYVYNIYFSDAESSYKIYCYSDMENPLYKKKILPRGIRFDKVRSTYKDNKLSFNSRGKPLPYPCTISLINGCGQYKKITITVATDYISIKDN